MNPEQFQLIEGQLLRLVTAYSDQLPEQDVRELSSLVNAGEPGVALENLCSQLYEYELRVSSADLDQILQLGNLMGLDLSRWKPLFEEQ